MLCRRERSSPQQSHQENAGGHRQSPCKRSSSAFLLSLSAPQRDETSGPLNFTHDPGLLHLAGRRSLCVATTHSVKTDWGCLVFRAKSKSSAALRLSVADLTAVSVLPTVAHTVPTASRGLRLFPLFTLIPLASAVHFFPITMGGSFNSDGPSRPVRSFRSAVAAWTQATPSLPALLYHRVLLSSSSHLPSASHMYGHLLFKPIM